MRWLSSDHNESNWQRWFAWYPVMDEYGYYTWLEPIWRKKRTFSVGVTSYSWWEYHKY